MGVTGVTSCTVTVGRLREPKRAIRRECHKRALSYCRESPLSGFGSRVTPCGTLSYSADMDATLTSIPFLRLLLALAPSLVLLAIMHRWSLGARSALYANARMLVQLLAVGYLLRYIFETDEPTVVVAVVAVMIGVASWIALRPLRSEGRAGARRYPQVLIAISLCGVAMLGLVSQVVLDLPRWFEPHVVVPLAGMIFANTMNTVSLAAERFEAECRAGTPEATDRAFEQGDLCRAEHLTPGPSRSRARWRQSEASWWVPDP
jgi:hypothetical protein